MKKIRVVIMGAAGAISTILMFIFATIRLMRWSPLPPPKSPISKGESIPPNWPGNCIPRVFPSIQRKTWSVDQRSPDRQVVFAYSDVSHEYVMHRPRWCWPPGRFPAAGRGPYYAQKPEAGGVNWAGAYR